MIRLHPGRSRRALDHVQPVHVAVGIAALGEIADVARVAGKSGVEKISVERNDDVGLRKVVARLDRLAEGQLRAFEHVVAIDRLVDMPLGLRINRQEVAHLIGQRGRRNGRRQNANARALQCFLRAQRPAKRAAETTSTSAHRP